MKKTVKVLSLLLALVMLFALSACGETETTTTTTTSTTTTSTSANGTEDVGGEAVAAFPLVDEKSELTLWLAWSSTLLESPNQIEANIWLEELTNVHIEYQLAASSNSAELFNLMVASGEYEDIITCTVTQYVGGIDKAIADEVYVPANDYLQYAPTFSAARASNDDFRKQSTTDTGNVYFAQLQSGNQPAWMGPEIRTEWVKEIGIDYKTLKTYDDVHNVLTQWKDKLGKTNTMWLDATGYEDGGFSWIGGYGVNGTFYNENGTVKYGPIENGFREYLEMMATWYAEDLIVEDFYAQTARNAFTDAYMADKVGLGAQSFTTQKTLSDSYAGETAWRAIPILSKDGSVGHFRRYNEISGNRCSFITTGAVERNHAELAAKWIDARYVEEVAFVLCYGIEGTMWTLGDDGLPHYTDFYFNNPDGYTQSNLNSLYTDSSSGAGYYMWIRQSDQYRDYPYVTEAYDIWNASATGDWVMPPISMTSEEANAYSAIIADIETYIDEFVMNVILGNTELNDDTWNDYVEWIKGMKIDECIGYQQAALTRYLNR